MYKRQIENDTKVYQAITGIASGGGAPTHTDASDTGGWRYLAAAKVEQKGLASFAQEDFDVDDNGHVSIAALGVDNTQLQNNRISFSDNNTQQHFELDQELTVAGSHHGFDYLNYVKSETLIVHRINECDERKGTNFVNKYLIGANNVADQTVFVSDWLMRLYLDQGLNIKNNRVIMAGANNEIFNNRGLSLIHI